MNITMQTKAIQNGTKLLVAGEVDAHTAPQLFDQLVPLVQRTANQSVVVDLAEVSYLDSTGLGVFVGALKLSQQTGCRLSIQNVTPRIERLFRITGLIDIIPVTPLEESAAGQQDQASLQKQFGVDSADPKEEP
ncbi:anti-sigma factor antagonist [Brevibacillus sp. B_LB10_24]|uniref:anti-sigma factor antagonist n=1 Tax=Brevibacillus sp. B_LB10_24 TaxID=3380645 RepID=UPI0038BB1181